MPRQTPLYSYQATPDPCDPVEIPVESGGNPFPELAEDFQAVGIAPWHGETTTTFASYPVEWALDGDWAAYNAKFPELAEDFS